MPIVSSSSDILFLLITAAIVAALTALGAKLFGYRIARKSRLVAALACALAVPLAIVVVAIILLATAPQGPPPNDGPAMLFLALTTLALISAAVSFPTSALLIYRKRP
jgi:hypothetical protein